MCFVCSSTTTYIHILKKQIFFQLIESCNKERGPYLARLELHKRMREKSKNADHLLGDFLELMVEYFR